MRKAILTDMKINSGITFYPEGQEKKEYCIFKICSIRPVRKNIYFTGNCRASGYLMKEVERLKLHEGSLVDIVATIEPYLDKNQNLQISYEISEISICESFPESKEKPNDNKQKEKEKEVNKLFNMLKTDPFGKGLKNGLK